MKQLMLKVIHLQKVYEQFTDMAKYHKGLCEELYFLNNEQAEAQYQQCLFWVGKSERVHGKLRELSGCLTRVLRMKYGLPARGRDKC